MNILKKIKVKVFAHKVVSGIVFIILVGAGYGIYSHYAGAATTTRYVMGKAATGNLVTSITGIGQVAASEQTNIIANVSGDLITSIPVKAGDEVTKGQVVAYIDSGDAVKAVSNAELALENAKLEYEKAQKENASQQSDSSTSDLKKAYESGYNAVANAFIDLPAIFMGVSDIYYTPAHSPYFSDNNIQLRAGSAGVAYKLQAGISFDDAKRQYDAAFNAYKKLTVDSSPAEITSLLNSTQSILKQLLSALSGTYSTIEYVNDRYTSAPPSEMSTDKSVLSGYISKVNSNSSSVDNALTSIDNAKDSAATSNLGMRSAELAQSKAADSLRDANTALADHAVRAPFSGLIAKVPAKVGDKSSMSATIATIISKEKLVTISLNEIDAAKVKAGDMVSLTFDALEDLKLAGHVSNVDLVGTVSQGVVSYSVEIAFDQNDDRVKPGMTVNAEIVAASKDGVLLIPSSAVKTTGGKSNVQVMSNGVPVTKEIKIGASNDSSVEVVSGLSEGDEIIVKTIVTTAAAQTSSLFSSLTSRNRGAAGTTTTGGTRTTTGTRTTGTAGMTGNATFAAPAGAASVQVITR